jgi:FMN phosphatase YigB (HAD superfamily)
VLEDLGFPEYLQPMALSEEVKIEKPDVGIFQWALSQSNGTAQGRTVSPEECLHVGDELAA